MFLAKKSSKIDVIDKIVLKKNLCITEKGSTFDKYSKVKTFLKIEMKKKLLFDKR